MEKQKTKDLRLSIRIMKKQKQLLEEAAQHVNMSINDYIKHKLIDTNKDLNNDEYRYEVAPGSKHDYITVGAEYFNHYLIIELIKKLYPGEVVSLYDKAHKQASAKINAFGYHKHSNKNNNKKVEVKNA